MSAIKPDGYLWKRSKEKRIELNLSQIESARKIGVTQPVIQRIENNVIKQPKCIVDMARVYGTTPEYLIGGVGFSSKGTESFYKKVPILTTDEAIKWCNPELNDILPDEKKFIYNPIESDKENYFALKISSPSMEKKLPFNSVAILEPLESEELNSGDFYLFHNSVKGNAFVRQFVIDNEKYMKPLNSDFPLEIINKNIKIIAKVVFNVNILDHSKNI